MICGWPLIEKIAPQIFWFIGFLLIKFIRPMPGTAKIGMASLEEDDLTRNVLLDFFHVPIIFCSTFIINWSVLSLMLGWMKWLRMQVLTCKKEKRKIFHPQLLTNMCLASCLLVQCLSTRLSRYLIHWFWEFLRIC